MGLFQRLEHLEFRKIVWILPGIWTLHEAEEWNILAWYQRFWVNIPEMTEVTIWTWLGFISLCGFFWTLIATLPAKPRFSAFFVLPFFTFFAFTNALQHIWFLIYFKAYNPGLVSAVFLVIPFMLYVTTKALRSNLIPWWYVVIAYLPIVPGLLTAIKAGNEVPEVIHRIYGFSAHLAKALWGTH